MTDEKRIEAEAHEIAHCIRRLSMLDQDSRAKVLATVHAYYGLGSDSWPEELKAMQERMAAANEQMRKLTQTAWAANVEDMDDEEKALCELVRDFAQAMLDKMLVKYREEDYEGWDDESISNIDDLWESLQEHVEKGSEPDNLVDIANFCAFIWNLRRKA